MSTKLKIVKGGFNLAASKVYNQFLAIGINILLARLLLPKDFGLIALATTYIGFISNFTNIGFGSAIIHYHHASQKELSSLYWLNLIISIISFVFVISTAPFAADFYSEPTLIYVVWFASINMLISPLFSNHYKMMERDLEFTFLSRVTIIATTIGSIAAVVAAFFGLGVYALVIQIVLTTLIRGAIILYKSKWKPDLCLQVREVKNMLWYSVKFKASSTALYIERNVDYLIMGRTFSSSVLGYYAFAYNIMYTPVKRISYIFSEVLFPAFSSIQENPQKIIKGYFKSVQLIAIVSFPGMILLAFNADWIIPSVFGDHWREAIPIVKVLCFAGAIQSISQIGGVIFSSIGKPEISFYVSIARTTLVIIAIVIGSLYGILMVAYLLVIAKFLSLLIILGTIYGEIHFRITEYLNCLKGPIVCSILLTIIHFSMTYFEVLPTSFLKLLLMSFVAVGVILFYHFDILFNLYKVLGEK